MIKGSILQEDILTLNVLVYASLNSASKCVMHKLIELKGEMDKFTVIVEDFNISMSVIDRSSMQSQQEYS